MISEGTQIDILMKEYATMREEVLLHFRNTKLHTRYFQLFFTAALVIIWYLFFVADVPAKDAAGKEVSDHLQDILTTIGIKKADLLLYLISALDITSYYFAFDILNSYFCVFLAAARLANIEKQINDTWGRKLLIWEFRVSISCRCHFWSFEGRHNSISAFTRCRRILAPSNLLLLSIIRIAELDARRLVLGCN